MRILITTDVYKTVTSGVTVSVNNLYDGLKKRGHNVRILTVSDGFRSYIDGDVTYIRSAPLPIYRGIRMPLSFRHSLIKDLIRWKPDIIHSQCEFFTYQYALYISKRTGAPILHTYHTMYEDYANYLLPGKKLGNFAVKKFVKYRLKDAKRIIAPSEKIEKKLKNYFLTSPISVIPTGIDLKSHLKERNEHESRKTSQAKLNDGLFLLIFLGRLGHEKNIEEIIRYFASAAITMPEISLLIVGDGPQRESLEKMAFDYGIDDRILFVGKVSHELVSEYYQSADLFVSASTSETQGLTYIEACANGLPLLCRKDDVLRGVIIEGENGYTYENEDDFLFYLKKIINNPKWRKDASRKSREIAQSYAKENFAKAVEKIYKENI